MFSTTQKRSKGNVFLVWKILGQMQLTTCEVLFSTVKPLCMPFDAIHLEVFKITKINSQILLKI